MTKEDLLVRYELDTGVVFDGGHRDRLLALPMEQFLAKLNEYWDWSRCGGKIVISEREVMPLV